MILTNIIRYLLFAIFATLLLNISFKLVAVIIFVCIFAVQTTKQNAMNHLTHPTLSPDYSHTYIQLIKCDICENEVDEDITVKLTATLDTICAGCAKMLNVADYLNGDGTPEQIQEIINELKPLI